MGFYFEHNRREKKAKRRAKWRFMGSATGQRAGLCGELRDWTAGGFKRGCGGVCGRGPWVGEIWLFDLGYVRVTVTPDSRLLVSRRLKDEWQNGKAYYAHHGQELQIQPEQAADRPAPELLRWHNERCFRE